MRILVTGSAGHLGEALVHTLRARGDEVVALDVLDSPCTTLVGSIVDREFVRGCMSRVDAVLHAATLHKPHVATHPKQAFVDVNVTGTLNLLEAAAEANVRAFVYTSTTSAFGRALSPPPGAPAAWITEEVRPVPKNVYGVTKIAAEDLCELIHREARLPVLVLRTSRFFPETDDDPLRAGAFDDTNLKLVEYLYRRVDIEDVVGAHLCALGCAPVLGFGRYIVSATTPFAREDLAELHRDAVAVLRRRLPEFEDYFASRGWAMLPTIDRVYVNERARRELGWQPKHDFRSVLARLRQGGEFQTPLARTVGSKGYHR